jgi:ribonuclease-3
MMFHELEQRLNYKFKNKETLQQALTHKSYHEGVKKGLADNEKMEFLGDSVINLVITEYLFREFENLKEGELSKLKAHLVSTDFLFEIATSIQLMDFILLGKGEEKNNGRSNKKIIASLFEAVVGAIYLDSDFKTTCSLILPYFKTFLENHITQEIKINDYKSELQEMIQKHHNILPTYHIIKKTGIPPHTTFTAAVMLNDNEIGRGRGRNKRQAEQDAAFNALRKNEEFINYQRLSEVFFLKND